MLVIGRSPRPLARFLSAWVRYAAHVTSFLYVAGNPFPGFVGAAGSYPIDVRIDPFARQSRWITLFRLPLMLPAMLVSSAAGGVALFASIFGWFVSLVRGRMPDGLQAAIAYSVGYAAQFCAYAVRAHRPLPALEPAGGVRRAGARATDASPRVREPGRGWRFPDRAAQGRREPRYLTYRGDRGRRDATRLGAVHTHTRLADAWAKIGIAGRIRLVA